MIVVDSSGQVSEWLKDLDIESSGVTRVDFQTFELAKGFETELVMVEDTVYLQMSPLLRDKLNRVEAVFLFRTNDRPIGHYISKIIMEVTKETPKSLLENQLLYIEDQIRRGAVVKSQMLSLNHELTQALGNMDLQLKRVKKTYEEKTPKRLEDFKGVTAMSKYAAGEDVGGEFFDLFTHENKVFILMSSCSSYLASSSLLQFFSEMKAGKNISKEAELEFLKKTHDEVKILNETRKKPIKVEVFSGIFDATTLQFQGHKFGDFQFISSDLKKKIDIENLNLANPEKSYFEVTLDRGERVLLNSPGFQKNWNVAKPDFLIEELMIDSNMKSLDILDEIYFKLKSKSLNGFLTFDASSIIVEVKHNVILKV